MFGYYLELAARSLRRSPGLTALMMLSIGFGVAASMTTYSVFRGLSGDPIPWKSSKLFMPQIDIWGPGNGFIDEPPRCTGLCGRDDSDTSTSCGPAVGNISNWAVTVSGK